jgi:hypothetical protein
MEMEKNGAFEGWRSPDPPAPTPLIEVRDSSTVNVDVTFPLPVYPPTCNITPVPCPIMPWHNVQGYNVLLPCLAAKSGSQLTRIPSMTRTPPDLYTLPNSHCLSLDHQLQLVRHV